VSKKIGRPPKDNPKTASIHLRVTPEEKTKIMDYCKKQGITCLELLQRGMRLDG